MNIIIQFLQSLIDEKFTGKIEIDLFKGGIATIRKFETFKPNELEGAICARKEL